MIKRNITSALKLLNQGFGKYKPQIAILVILGFFAGLLEGIGVNAIIPLFSFVNTGPGGDFDAVSRIILKFFAYFHIHFSVGSLIAFICSLFIIKTLVSLLVNYISTRINANYELQKRGELFRHTLQASWPYLLNQKIGHLEKILITDVGSSAALLRYLSGGILLFTSLVMYALIAFNISSQITLVTLVLGGVLFLGFKPLADRTQKISKGFLATLKTVAHRVNENIIGIKTIKAGGTEEQIIAESGTYFKNLAASRIQTSWLNSIALSMIQPIALIFISLVFALTYKTPTFNFASFAVIIYLIQRIFTYVQALQEKFQNVNEMFPYLRSVVDYEKTIRTNPEPTGGSKPFTFRKTLELKNVAFSYSREKNLIENLNFTIKKGEMVGLVGASGAGKTTIVDLLLRLFIPTSGQIFADGQNILEIDLQSWRQNIGYVSQDIFLLNDTIENNIRFYNPRVSTEDVIKAAKMANILEFAESQPDGFATIVGERGMKLSGGQRQRIILARVLARKPVILILDEATSALDNESEIQIQKAITNLKGQITTIIIAHRLSTIMNTDRLLILENGTIIEQGSPQELLKDKNSYFFKVYTVREPSHANEIK